MIYPDPGQALVLLSSARLPIESVYSAMVCGILEPATWEVNADITFGYGNLQGDTPLVGDWDGDNIDTIGVQRKGVFYLQDSNTKGIADLDCTFGQSGDVSEVGDSTGM
jgi:hypothetical protein